MPISEIKFQPGINRELTNYAGKGGYYDCNKIRFRTGQAEKLGGWANTSPNYTFNGVARTFWNWFTIAGENLIAFGTNQRYYVQSSIGTTYQDITPVNSTVSSLTNPFTTTSGSLLVAVADSFGAANTTAGSFITLTIPTVATTGASGTGALATITFAAQAYAAAAGSTVVVAGVSSSGSSYSGTYTVVSATTTSVTFSSPATGAQLAPGTIALPIGGSVSAGSYEVISLSGSGYNIATSVAATYNGASIGGSVSVTYSLPAGNAVVTPSSGWGAPPWGSGGWGSSSSTATPLRLWSQANFGDDLVMAYRAGPIYYWTKNTTNYTPAVTINAKAASVVKTQQTVTVGVTAGASGSSFTIANSQGVDYGATLTLISGAGGSSIPTGTYVALSPTYTGYTIITVVIPSGTITLAPGDIVGFSYSGKCAPNETNQIIISSANQFTIALGSTPYDPSNATPAFSPTLVRWSDQSIPYEWTPTTSDQSGEQTLANGSYIVGGLSTRQEVLIWTDRALYSMQYIGAPFVFTFQLMMDNISIVSPNAAITVNGATYWMGVDKFFIYNGTVQPLPCTVRKYIFSNLNFSQRYQVVCGQNEALNEIWWFYPSSNSAVNDSYVTYNYIDNTWYYGTMNRTAWLDSSLQNYPMAMFSYQTSYLSAAVTAAATSIPIINGLSYPSPPNGTTNTIILDSEQITYTSISNNAFSGCVRGANGTTAASHLAYTDVGYYIPNQVIYHEYGNDDQTPSTGNMAIASYLQTSDFDIGGGDHFGYLWRMLPDFSFQGSTSSGNPTIYLTVNPRLNSGTAYTTGNGVDSPPVINTQAAPIPPNTTPVEQFTGQVYTRVRGRQMNFCVQSVGMGVFWQMGTMRFDIRPDGRR